MDYIGGNSQYAQRVAQAKQRQLSGDSQRVLVEQQFRAPAYQALQKYDDGAHAASTSSSHAFPTGTS